jgi:hypothetical protein
MAMKPNPFAKSKPMSPMAKGSMGKTKAGKKCADCGKVECACKGKMKGKKY